MSDPITLGATNIPIVLKFIQWLWSIIFKKTPLKVFVTVKKTHDIYHVMAHIVNRSGQLQFIEKCQIMAYSERSLFQKINFLWVRRKKNYTVSLLLLKRDILGCFSCVPSKGTNRVEVNKKVTFDCFEDFLCEGYKGLAILEVETSLGDVVYSKPFDINKLRKL